MPSLTPGLFVTRPAMAMRSAGRWQTVDTDATGIRAPTDESRDVWIASDAPSPPHISLAADHRGGSRAARTQDLPSRAPTIDSARTLYGECRLDHGGCASR